MNARFALRWILVPVAAWLAWMATLLLGFGVLEFVDSLCPEKQRYSGGCLAPWYEPVTRILFVSCAAIAGALVVLAPTWMAPSHRSAVAWLALIGGAVWAMRMALVAQSWIQFAVAIAAGTIAAFWIGRSRAPARRSDG